MNASAGLHWWTFVTPRHSAEAVLDRMGGAHSRVESVGGYGHPRSIVHESGARIYFGSNREDQPVCVNMPGEVCEGWAAEGVAWAEDLGAIVTRNDAAVDVGPDELARGRMKEMRRAWKSGKVETKIRTFQEHRSDDGWTWYFGGKSANTRVRAYDRRGPLRLEVQLRPERNLGERLPEMVARQGVGAVWRSVMSGLVFPMTWYRDLLDGEKVELVPTIREESLFAKAVEQIRSQFGSTAWALSQLGLTLGDLAVEPEPPIRGDLAAKFLRWADEAEDEGYDGEMLRREVKCKLK